MLKYLLGLFNFQSLQSVFSVYAELASKTLNKTQQNAIKKSSHFRDWNECEILIKLDERALISARGMFGTRERERKLSLMLRSSQESLSINHNYFFFQKSLGFVNFPIFLQK